MRGDGDDDGGVRWNAMQAFNTLAHDDDERSAVTKPMVGNIGDLSKPSYRLLGGAPKFVSEVRFQETQSWVTY